MQFDQISREMKFFHTWKWTKRAEIVGFCRRRSRGEEDTSGVEESSQQQQSGYVAAGQRDTEEEEELGAEEAAAQAAQTLQSGAEGADPEVHKRVAAVQVQVQGMEGDWRTYCEHPLSVATAAMLNLQQQHQVSAVASHGDDPAPYVYEYYKLPEKNADVKLPPTHELWSTWVSIFPLYFSCVVVVDSSIRSHKLWVKFLFLLDSCNPCEELKVGMKEENVYTFRIAEKKFLRLNFLRAMQISVFNIFFF